MDVGIWLEATFWSGLLGALASAASLIWSTRKTRLRERERAVRLREERASRKSARRRAATARSGSNRAGAPRGPSIGATPLRSSRVPAQPARRTLPPRVQTFAASVQLRPPRAETEVLPVSHRPHGTEPPPETRDASTDWPVSRCNVERARRSPRNTEALSETIDASATWPVSRRVEEQAKRVVRDRTVTQRPDADVTVQYDAATLARLGVDESRDVAGPSDLADVVRRADAGQIAHLNTYGLSAVGFVTGIWVREFCGVSRMELGVRVTRPGGETYDARAPITEIAPRYRHGEPIAVRYDPKRPQLIAVDRGWIPTVVQRMSA